MQFDNLTVFGRLRNSGIMTAESQISVLGSLAGTGTIVTRYVDVSGTISPGDGIGTMYLVGDLTFGPFGTFLAELDGANSDLLQIIGGLSLSHEFNLGENLVLTGGVPGNSYSIINYTSSRFGVFESVTPGYDVIYDNVAKQIRVQVIPEPASVVLAFVGVVSAVVASRARGSRKRR
jgi:hypothetical protein